MFLAAASRMRCYCQEGFSAWATKLFAIPWMALHLDTERKCFVLDVSREQLESAPGFDKDRWPNMAYEPWGREVHGYYKARVYWE
jgi:hypothetical protein